MLFLDRSVRDTRLCVCVRVSVCFCVWYPFIFFSITPKISHGSSIFPVIHHQSTFCDDVTVPVDSDLITWRQRSIAHGHSIKIGPKTKKKKAYHLFSQLQSVQINYGNDNWYGNLTLTLYLPFSLCHSHTHALYLHFSPLSLSVTYTHTFYISLFLCP